MYYPRYVGDNPTLLDWFKGTRIGRAILGSQRGKFQTIDQSNYRIGQSEYLISTDTTNLMTVAATVPHLANVINYGAKLFSLADVKHIDKDGNPIEGSPLLKKLRQPNPLQSLEDFLMEYYAMNAVYGKTYQHIIKGLSYQMEPDVIWLLPPSLIKLTVSGKSYRQSSIDDIIKKIEIEGDGEPFDKKNILYIPDGIGSDILNPVSPIQSLQIPLSNLQAALKSINRITAHRGADGVLSISKTTDGGDEMPYDDKESLRIKKKYQYDYDLDNEGKGIIPTNGNVSWTPLTMDVEALGFYQTIEESFAAIIAAYGHDRDIYPSVKGATFENKNQGLRSTINNAIRPLADKLMRRWTERFCEPGTMLVADYDYLPVMKEDELKRAQQEKVETDRLKVLYDAGLISAESWAEMEQVEFSGDGIAKVQPTQINLNNGQNQNQ